MGFSRCLLRIAIICFNVIITDPLLILANQLSTMKHQPQFTESRKKIKKVQKQLIQSKICIFI